MPPSRSPERVATTGAVLALAALSVLVSLAACSAILGVKGDRELEADGGVGSADGSVAPVVDTGAVEGALESAADAADAEGGAPSPDLTALNAHADDALEALLLNFWNRQYFVETPGNPPPASTFAQAWEVALAAADRHHQARFTGTFQMFFDVQAQAGWSFDRYDDENWMILALIHAYDVTLDATYLLQARALYQDLVAAWDTTCCAVGPITIPGGIWHDHSQDRKSTAVNAGAVISGVRLYERTKITSYLSFAKQVYAYWSANMVTVPTHQVLDNVSANGVQGLKYTYDQGVMIGAAVAIAGATGDPAPLASAHDFAAFLLSAETVPSPSGLILFDGPAASCQGECALYKGIAVRYLADLYAADTSHGEYLALLAQCADSIWKIARDPSGLYGPDWGAAYAGTPFLSATAAAAGALASVAALGPPVTGDPSATYEAEEATIHGVGLEAKYSHFSGWGYVAGWGCASSPAEDAGCVQDQVDGTGVDFRVSAPSAGGYDLNLTYSAIAETDASTAASSRRLLVNGGAYAIDDLPFPATQDWNTWATISVPRVPLQAGYNSVSLTFDTARGSYGFINLDNLVFASPCPTSENLLQAQPAYGDWHASFSNPFTMTFEGYICGEPVLHWMSKSVMPGNWITIYPNNPPFYANLAPGQTYVASVTMSGTGTYHLDVWDAPGTLPDGGAGGVGDNYTSSATLTDEPHSFWLPFRMGGGAVPELQVRVDGSTPTVDVDALLWHIAIYAQ
jgi:predicted alpha-1,6-mannanase (GH76 family)